MKSFSLLFCSTFHAVTNVIFVSLKEKIPVPLFTSIQGMKLLRAPHSFAYIFRLVYNFYFFKQIKLFYFIFKIYFLKIYFLKFIFKFIFLKKC